MNALSVCFGAQDTRKYVVLLTALCVPLFVHPASAESLHNGLVAYWALDEGTGETAADAFGEEADDGLLRESPSWLGPDEAILGESGLFFDGNFQDVLVNDSMDLEITTNAVTLSAWFSTDFLPDELPENFAGIYDSAQDSYILYLDKGNNELRFKVTDSNGTAERPGVPTSILTTEKWHHVMGVYDGSEALAKIYFDGQLVDSHSNAALVDPVKLGQVAGIGSNPTDDPMAENFFLGSIDDVAVWNRSLGRGEALYLYNEGMGNAVGTANPDIAFISDRPPIEPVAPSVAPVIHYAFEGNLQSSGTGGATYDGTLLDTPGVNDPPYGPGAAGQGLDLRENPDAATGGDAVSVDYVLTDSGTIVFDYTVDKFYNYQSLFTNSVDANDWEMWIYDTGELRGRVDADTPVSLDLNTVGGLDNTYQIAFNWQRDGDNVAVELYVDGELQGQASGGWIDPGETFYIGGGDGGNDYGAGIFDEFMIYDEALAAGGILYLFAEPDLPTPLQAGDADQDLDFDQLDLVQVQIAAKYLSGQAATWGEGDWDGAPGGQAGAPPTGNGLFDQVDIITALSASKYLAGSYGALAVQQGRVADAQTSLVYDAGSGELSVDAPVGQELTSINITSAGSIFTGEKPAALDGSFDNFSGDNVFKATFGSSFGSISFGGVLPAGLSEGDVTADLSVIGSLDGGGGLGSVDLVYIPEPAGMTTALIGIALLAICRRRRGS